MCAYSISQYVNSSVDRSSSVFSSLQKCERVITLYKVPNRQPCNREYQTVISFVNPLLCGRQNMLKSEWGNAKRWMLATPIFPLTLVYFFCFFLCCFFVWYRIFSFSINSVYTWPIISTMQNTLFFFLLLLLKYIMGHQEATITTSNSTCPVIYSASR